jgi:hypothetical protein
MQLDPRVSVLEEDLEDEDLMGASDEESEAEPAAKEAVCVAREVPAVSDDVMGWVFGQCNVV